MRRVKITQASGNQQTNGKKSYKIGLPVEIGDLLYKHGLEYEVSLTPDGVLLKPVHPAPNQTIEDPPDWVRRLSA